MTWNVVILGFLTITSPWSPFHIPRAGDIWVLFVRLGLFSCIM
jgi:hypothetical protein